jgi:hypothetical protein
MATVMLGDQQIQIQDFSAYKFLEATELLSQILGVVPELDPVLTSLAQQHATDFQRRLENARGVAKFGAEALPDVPNEMWEGLVGNLIEQSNPSGADSFVRVFPVVLKKARQPTEHLVALLATENSKLEADDEQGRNPYEKGGSVHEKLRMIRHHAKLSQQLGLVLACVRQLADELRESDMAGQMGNLREALTDLQRAMNPEADSSAEQTDAETSDPPVTSPEPSSSTPSSLPTPAVSPGETSSTGSPIAS